MLVGKPFLPRDVFVGVFLPNALIEFRNISAGAKLCWGRLAGKLATSESAWARISLKHLATGLGIGRRQVLRYMRELEHHQLVERSFKNDGGPVLYALLWHGMFEHKIKATEGGTHMSRGGTHMSPPNRKKKESYTKKEKRDLFSLSTHDYKSPLKSKTDRQKEQKGHPRWRKMSQLLMAIIQARHKVNYKSRLSSWDEAFRKLHQLDGVPVMNIWKILRWYRGACAQDQEYLPIVESGMSLRKKWIRLENAHHRDTGQMLNKPKKRVKKMVKRRMSRAERRTFRDEN